MDDDATSGGVLYRLNDHFEKGEWREAHVLATGFAHELHPDYVRKAAAHLSHELRHTAAGEGAAEVLEFATELPDADPQTFYGDGMIAEEEGLLARYFGGDTLDSLTMALGFEVEAASLYDKAAGNVDNEIVDADEIENRRLRVTGVAGTIEIKLADIAEDDETRDIHLKRAVEYAGTELDARIANGEEPSHGLATAYSQMGMAQGMAGNYQEAIDNLQKAVEVADKAGLALESSVYKFRLAAEVHRADPDNKDKIAEYLGQVLEAHQDGKTAEDGRWTAGVMKTLERDMFDLAAHLDVHDGKDYRVLVSEMYAAPTE